jgi:hypothetical protein
MANHGYAIGVAMNPVTSHADAIHEHAGVAPYPVSVTIGAQVTTRNRLTVAARPILAVPHAILVGPIYWSFRTGGLGLIGAAAYVLAVVSWFTLLLRGRHLPEIREFSLFYLRWRLRAVAYMGLLRDEYPPFGDAAYPASLDVVAPENPRDLVSIGARPILAVPHLVVLPFLLVAWLFTTVAAWIVILLTGHYPDALYTFAVGVIRWTVRIEAYLLLLVDEFPPFTLE